MSEFYTLLAVILVAIILLGFILIAKIKKRNNPVDDTVDDIDLLSEQIMNQAAEAETNKSLDDSYKDEALLEALHNTKTNNKR